MFFPFPPPSQKMCCKNATGLFVVLSKCAGAINAYDTRIMCVLMIYRRTNTCCAGSYDYPLSALPSPTTFTRIFDSSVRIKYRLRFLRPVIGIPIVLNSRRPPPKPLYDSHLYSP